MKKALITGITGQDGSWLAELLLDKDYEVHGLVRRSSAGYDGLRRNLKPLIADDEIYRKRLFLHAGDLGDASSINRIIQDVQPDEVYNLAAQADVAESFLMPEYSVDVNGNGVIRLLEAIRRFKPDAKFYQASTSELFGNTASPQNEETPMNPQSPYAWGKMVGYQAVKIYRDSYNLFACNGILFNHESERRGDDYLTRKVTKAVARIKAGVQDKVRLGNLEAKRDWGYAKEFVEYMWKMLQIDTPDDYVLGTGETRTVEDWVKAAFYSVGLDYKKHVIQDPKLFRPAEVYELRADYSKAKKVLGFDPKIRFNELVQLMVNHDVDEISRF